MTLAQIKKQIGIDGNFTLVPQIDETGEKTGWLSYWDGIERIRVSMPESLIKTIKTEKKLRVHSNRKISASGEPYIAHVIGVMSDLEEKGAVTL